MDKKDAIWKNLLYLLRQMAVWTRDAFYFLLLRIPLKVMLPFLSILLSKIVVEELTKQGDLTALLQTVLLFGSLLTAGSFLEQYAAGRMDASTHLLQQKFSDTIFEKKMQCAYDVLENQSIAGKFQEAEHYIWSSRRYLCQIGENLVLLGSGMFGFCLYLSILNRLSIWLLLLLIAAAILSFHFTDLGEKQRVKSGNYWGEALGKMGYLQWACAEPAAGKDIRLYHMTGWFQKKLSLYIKQMRAEYTAIEKKNFLSGIITAILNMTVETVAYVYLIHRVLARQITVAEFVLYIGAVLGFSTWIRQLAEQLTKLGQMSQDISCIRACMELVQQERGEEKHPVLAKDKMPCKIEFDHVSFSYAGSNQETICDLSFTIEPGERIALVGMNGAGKTTCVKLLCGLLFPTKGEVRINGISSKEVDREEYYRLFATVFQEVCSLPVTVRENITQQRSGEEDAGRLKACVEMAGLTQKISTLPKGLDTLLVKEIEKEAVNLSGGELQRLLLARALYKQAPILVLDEPTAALDPISEDNIYRKYRQLTEGSTSVFISHRLASTRFCHRILYLKEGHLEECGSHEELMAKHGEYAKAFEVQSHYYKDHPEEIKGEVVFE